MKDKELCKISCTTGLLSTLPANYITAPSVSRISLWHLAKVTSLACVASVSMRFRSEEGRTRGRLSTVELQLFLMFQQRKQHQKKGTEASSLKNLGGNIFYLP